MRVSWKKGFDASKVTEGNYIREAGSERASERASEHHRCQFCENVTSLPISEKKESSTKKCETDGLGSGDDGVVSNTTASPSSTTMSSSRRTTKRRSLLVSKPLSHRTCMHACISSSSQKLLCKFYFSLRICRCVSSNT